MDAPVIKLLMTVWPVCACGLPMSGRCALALNFCPVTFDLGDKTLTLCVSDGDGSTHCGALADIVSFPVLLATLNTSHTTHLTITPGEVLHSHSKTFVAQV